MPHSSVPSRSPAVTVRDSLETDMVAITAIYAVHVRQGLATFEETPPGVEEMAARRAALMKAEFPYLVAVDTEGSVLGYAYVSSYRTRSAYRHTIENSIYVADGLEGRGIGRALLTHLLERCEGGPWRQVVAVIGDSGNVRSIALHEALGFRRAGLLRSVGFKFGRWVDSVLMQRPLGDGDDTQPAPRPPRDVSR